jgi:hypothetical protein
VRVEIVDVGQCGAGIGDGLAHGLDRPVAGRVRIGDAVAGQRVAVSCQFGIDARAALARRVPLFQHQEARAFAEHETVARGVEGAAGALGGVVVRRHRVEQTKARQPHRVDHRIEAAG